MATGTYASPSVLITYNFLSHVGVGWVDGDTADSAKLMSDVDFPITVEAHTINGIYIIGAGNFRISLAGEYLAWPDNLSITDQKWQGDYTLDPDYVNDAPGWTRNYNAGIDVTTWARTTGGTGGTLYSDGVSPAGTVTVEVPMDYSNGYIVNLDGDVLYSLGEVADHHNGLPIDSDGYLVFEYGAPVYWSNGFPITSGGKIAVAN